MENPYVYHASVRWSGERAGVLSLSGKPDLNISPPPEFGGPPGVISPEDLFVSAVAACFMATFLAMCEKVRASFVTFSCAAEGVLDKMDGKGLAFTSVTLRPKVGIADTGEERAVRRALDLAKKYCIVSNSLACPVNMEPKVDVI